MSSTIAIIRHRLTLLAACLLWLAASSQSVQAARPYGMDLLPKSTVAYLSIRDTKELASKFQETALGQMMQDPQLKALLDKLYGQLQSSARPLEDTLGITLTELLTMPQGEVSLAVVSPANIGPQLVVLLDTGEASKTVDTLLDRGGRAAIDNGATQETKTIDGVSVTLYTLPGNNRTRQAIYFRKDATLAICSNLDLVRELIATWNGGKSATFAQNQQFAAISKHIGGAKGEEPQLTWFVDPINVLRGVGQGNSSVQLGLAFLPALGLDGLLGAGGSITFATPQFDMINRVHLLLDNPRAGVIEMLAMKTGEIAPERWVPAETASYTTLYWDVEKTYRKLATLVDSFQGDGAFKRQVQQRIVTQVEIDIEKDVLPQLDGRLTYITLVEEPYTLSSQGQLVGIKLKDASKFKGTFNKLVERFRNSIEDKSFGGKTYFLGPAPPTGDVAEAELARMRPAFGIFGDYLLIGRNSMIEKAILAEGDASKSLAEALDFKLIASKAQRQSATKPSLFNFNRPEEGLRMAYGLVQADSTKQSLDRFGENSEFARGIGQALKDNPLPPFASLTKYLAPGGAVLIDDETGFHYTSFVLRRKSE